MSVPLDKVDPFTQVFRAMWAQLESEPSFARLVPPGNRIKYDGDDRHPDKRQTSTADFPEVRIIASGGDVRLVNSSSDTGIGQVFQIQMASGDQRFTKAFLPIKWAVLEALSHTKNDPLNFGLAFVLNVEVQAVNDFPEDIEGRARGMWAGLLDVMVEMNFNTANQMQTD